MSEELARKSLKENRTTVAGFDMFFERILGHFQHFLTADVKNALASLAAAAAITFSGAVFIWSEERGFPATNIANATPVFRILKIPWKRQLPPHHIVALQRKRRSCFPAIQASAGVCCCRCCLESRRATIDCRGEKTTKESNWIILGMSQTCAIPAHFSVCHNFFLEAF